MGDGVFDRVMEVVGVMALAVAVALADVVLAILAGGVIGWIVEHSFLQEFVIGGIRVLFGFQIQPDQLPAIGTVLGFIGSFFKSSLNASHKKD